VLITLIRFAFSQTFTISSKSLVSPYIDEWIENNNFKIVNHSFNGPVKIFTKIFDNNNRLVLGTDTPYFKDAYDTLASNDTLNASSIFPVHRVYLDSPYSDLYDSLHYFIKGNYSLHILFLDTNGSLIDSVSSSFYIDSLIGPTLKGPKDSREVYYNLSNNVKFTFNHRDVNYNVRYQFVMKQLPDSFNVGIESLESVLLNPGFSDVVSFNINGDDTSVSFTEYGVIIILTPIKLTYGQFGNLKIV